MHNPYPIRKDHRQKAEGVIRALVAQLREHKLFRMNQKMTLHHGNNLVPCPHFLSYFFFFALEVCEAVRSSGRILRQRQQCPVEARPSGQHSSVTTSQKRSTTGACQGFGLIFLCVLCRTQFYRMHAEVYFLGEGQEPNQKGWHGDVAKVPVLRTSWMRSERHTRPRARYGLR